MFCHINRSIKEFSGDIKEYDFCPKTYVFPVDFDKFCAEREASGNKKMYIMKPNDSGCGNGIKIIG